MKAGYLVGFGVLVLGDVPPLLLLCLKVISQAGEFGSQGCICDVLSYGVAQQVPDGIACLINFAA